MDTTTEIVSDDRQPLCVALVVLPALAAMLPTVRVGRVSLRPTLEEWAALTPEVRAWAVATGHAGVERYRGADRYEPAPLDADEEPSWGTWARLAAAVVEAEQRREAVEVDETVASWLEGEPRRMVSAWGMHHNAPSPSARLLRRAANDPRILAALPAAREAVAREEAAEKEQRRGLEEQQAQSLGAEVERLMALAPAALIKAAIDDAKIRGATLTYQALQKPEVASRLRDARAAEAIEKEVEEARREASWKAYALALGEAAPSVSRAAREGYEYRGALVAWLAARVAATVAPLCVWKGVFAHGSVREKAIAWEQRSGPSETAFAAHDTIVAAVQALGALPEGLTVEVEKIMRCSVDASQTEEGWTGEDDSFTGVPVVFQSPVTTTRYLVIKAE